MQELPAALPVSGASPSNGVPARAHQDPVLPKQSVVARSCHQLHRRGFCCCGRIPNNCARFPGALSRANSNSPPRTKTSCGSKKVISASKQVPGGYLPVSQGATGSSVLSIKSFLTHIARRVKAKYNLPAGHRASRVSFLIITFQIQWHVVMNHKGHIGFVDSHSNALVATITRTRSNRKSSCAS